MSSFAPQILGSLRSSLLKEEIMNIGVIFRLYLHIITKIWYKIS